MRPIKIPPWDLGHGIQAGDLAESIGMAVAAIKAGKATDTSGLSNACMKGIKQEAVEKIAALLKQKDEVPPEDWKKSQGLFLYKNETRKSSVTTDC